VSVGTATGILIAMMVMANGAAGAQPQVSSAPVQTVRAAEVVFTGFTVLAIDEFTALKASVPLQPGKPVAFNDVQETLRRALDALRNKGYAYARVEALETTLAPDRVRLEIT
jgi:hemolysin activation/secretion protein